jgi:hypothetical protein
MKVEFEASGLRDGSRPEREEGWWAAKSTSSSTTPDPALGRRGIVFLVSECRRGLSISGHKVGNALRPEIPPCVFSRGKLGGNEKQFGVKARGQGIRRRIRKSPRLGGKFQI